jgi:hypothetical protein
LLSQYVRRDGIPGKIAEQPEPPGDEDYQSSNDCGVISDGLFPAVRLAGPLFSGGYREGGYNSVAVI